MNNKYDEIIKEHQKKSTKIIEQLKNDFNQTLKQKIDIINNDSSDTVTIDRMQPLMLLSDIGKDIERMFDGQRDIINKEIDSVESMNDNLQTLLYEKDLYQSQLSQLESSHPFDINDPSLKLSEESKFLESTSGYQSNHQSNKIIERLEWEMSKRIEKLKELENLRTLRKELREHELKKRKELADFDFKLKNNHITTNSILKPIQPYIKPIPQQSTVKSHPLLKQTPLPLFILYSEIQSFKNTEYHQIEIDIKCIDPYILQQQQQNIDTMDISSPQFKSYILTPSNIYISIKINQLDNNNDNEINLEFYYYPTLKIVTVLPNFNDSEVNGQTLLEQIDVNDKGLTTPNQSNHFIFGSETFSLSVHKLKGRPYKWAQYITGLSFLPEISFEDLHNPNFQLFNFKPKTTLEIMNILIGKINQ